MGIYTPAPKASLKSLKKYLKKDVFENDEILFNQNEAPTGCYLIKSGQVDSYYFDEDIQADSLLDSYHAGDVVGAVGLIDAEPRAITTVAVGDVEVFYISKEMIESLVKKDPDAYQEFLQLTTSMLTKKFRAMHEVIKTQAVSVASSPIVNDHVEKAVEAQKELLQWSEDRIDSLIQDISDAINKEAETLAAQCVEESGMGVVNHKVMKIRMGSLDVAQSLITKPGNGSLTLEAPDVEKMTMPMGVIFGMIPITNPVETIVFKTLISLKSRNAIIISSHRKGRLVGEKTVAIIQSVLRQHGAPINLVQTPSLAANRKVTNAFMKHDDINFILATGGPNMVRSAYQSGTPAIGVGKGNAPVWICKDADISAAAARVVASKSFDNGVVCGSENNLLVDADVVEDFVIAAEKEGAAYLSDAEIDRLMSVAFPQGRLSAEWNGQLAKDIAQAAQIERDYEIKLLLVNVPEGRFSSPLLREKLAPILSFVVMNSDVEALHHAKSILDLEGAGHTAIIHSKDKEKIRAYSEVVEVSRVLVNSSGTQGCIGAVNGLNLSWTLGCGTMGGGSTSDNVSYHHLQNTKRVAYTEM